MVFGWGRRVRRAGPDRYELRLPEPERRLLASLPAQMRELLESDDPSLRRLFPSAYPDDDERDAEFRRLVRDDLLARRIAALEAVEATVDQKQLTEEQLVGWLGAMNDLRLVIGTRLDVSEEGPPEFGDDEESQAEAGLYAVYEYLGALQEQIVAALDPEYGD